MTTTGYPDLIPVLPEIVLLAMTCVVLVVDLFLPQEKRGFTLLLSALALLVTAAAVFSIGSSGTLTTFSGTFIVDSMALTLKIAVLLMMLLVFFYSRDYLLDHSIYKGEYYVLGLFATLGMMIMVSAYSFLLVYLGLELLSLSLYTLVAMNRDSSTSSEAAMKYFVLGALASGLLLYGISLFYGVTGTLNFADLGAQLQNLAEAQPVLLAFAVTFIVVGLAFKLGAVPFHMWMPDVYQGAPTSVALIIGSAAKIAGFAMAIRLLVDGLSVLLSDWSQMLIVLAIVSMAVGNLIAIAQSSFKRMLAYSTISHVGFIFLGLLAGTSEGYSAAMFYTLTYVLSSAVAFGILILLNRKGFEAQEISDLRGLNDKKPWYAALMAIAMLSMAGVPPTVGFYAKLVVINAVVQVDLVWLAIIAVLFSVVGLFYYLRIIKVMYFDKPEEGSEITVKDALDVRILLSANSLSLLLLGLFPSSLMVWCVAAFS